MDPIPQPKKHTFKSLTLKQRKFAKRFVETGNATQAIIDAGYNAKDRINASRMASENLAKVEVRATIEESLIKAGLTSDFMTESLQKIAKAGTSDRALKKATPDVAIKALDMQAKLSNAYPEKAVTIEKKSVSYKIKGKSKDEVSAEVQLLMSRLQSLVGSTS